MTNAELVRIVEPFIEVCHRVEAKGFVAATDGNISARLPNGNVLITPASMSKAFVGPTDLVEVSTSGEHVNGRGNPSSEMDMHLFIYQHRPDVNAVVHCHPVYATAFATARIPLTECLFPEVIVGLGAVPLCPVRHTVHKRSGGIDRAVCGECRCYSAFQPWRCHVRKKRVGRIFQNGEGRTDSAYSVCRPDAGGRKAFNSRGGGETSSDLNAPLRERFHHEAGMRSTARLP